MNILKTISLYLLKSSVMTGLVMGLMLGVLLISPALAVFGARLGLRWLKPRLVALWGRLKGRTVAAGSYVGTRKGAWGRRLLVALCVLLYPVLVLVNVIIQGIVAAAPYVKGDFEYVRDGWKTGYSN